MNNEYCVFLQINKTESIQKSKQKVKLCLNLFRHVCVYGYNMNLGGFDEHIFEGMTRFPTFVFTQRAPGHNLLPIRNNDSIFLFRHMTKTKKWIVIGNKTNENVLGKVPDIRITLTDNVSVDDLKKVILNEFLQGLNTDRLRVFQTFVRDECIKKNATVVLDLDETLVCVRSIDSYTEDTLSNPAGMEQTVMSFDTSPNSVFNLLIRNHTRMFIQFCFARFQRVVVWSAGVQHYVHAIVHFLFLENGFIPDCVVTRNSVTVSADGVFNKDLKVLVASKRKSPFYMNETDFMSSVFMVDNTKSVADLNPDRLVLVKDFMGQNDDELLDIMDHLEQRLF